MITGGYLGRILTNVRVTPEGCWEWTGGTNGVGYGVLSFEGERGYVHRLIIQKFEGIEIPAGYQVDHLCRNTLCFRPDHLEPVTVSENIRRGVTGQKTHCKNGHAFDAVNTYITPQGHRFCRACRAARERERRALRREAACRS